MTVWENFVLLKLCSLDRYIGEKIPNLVLVEAFVEGDFFVSRFFMLRRPNHRMMLGSG